ncbi:MAG: hypothetical protein M1495_17450 [Bacteroidetes bacterium]|nr:hypothetical protein [Bacteroidota bacterium]
MSKRQSASITSTKEEINFLKSFKSPYDIQVYLNKIKYNPESITSSPKVVLERRSANCFEGALFAAAALRMLGHKPLIVDMIAENDDDHVIAIYKQNGCFGAVAKSNTTLLKFREPVYRTLRELVMSYFDFYFNTIGEKSLRSYSNPVDLSKFDKYNWMTTNDDLEFIGDYLYKVKHHKILTGKMLRSLSIADDELIKICFMDSVTEGLFKPEKKK